MTVGSAACPAVEDQGWRACARVACWGGEARLPLRLQAPVSMTTAMTLRADRIICRARGRSCAAVACALAALALTSPPWAGAAGATGQTTTDKKLGIPIPASARVKGTSASPTASAPASTTPTTSIPTATTPATPATTPTTTLPAGGAQPGTVAPAPPAPTTPATTAPPGASVPRTTTPATPLAGSTTAVGIARKTTPSHTRLSAGALALAALGALLALGCLVWALGRWLALEPRWTTSFVHSLREATYRASATWAEFSDWARLGH